MNDIRIEGFLPEHRELALRAAMDYERVHGRDKRGVHGAVVYVRTFDDTRVWATVSRLIIKDVIVVQFMKMEKK
jgi:hypothetical protein